MPGWKSLVPRRFRSKDNTALASNQAAIAVEPSSESGQAATTNIVPISSEPKQKIAPRTDKYGLFRFLPEGEARSQATGASSATITDATWPIDIVAIHGITGDAYKTWEHESGTLWLRDFLPQDFPGSRVFSYGYDADVFFTLGTGDLETFARTMLQHLKQTRVGMVDIFSTCLVVEPRLTFLIAESPTDIHMSQHGRTCGEEVYQAIIYAILKQTTYQDIRSSCVGVIFLGTPHRGSLQTGWPLLIANIANIATAGTSRFVGNTRTDLLKILQREAPVLEQLARDFADQPRNIKIASFVEQDITPPAKERIVDGVTGIMNSVGEEVIDMQGCDHRSICRFASRTNNYNLIQGIIRNWATEAIPPRQDSANAKHPMPQPVSRSEPDLECLRSLSFPEMNWRRLDLSGKASPKTCKWVFDHPVYLEWSASPQGPLWIKGKPGSGKSTLMEVIVQEFRQSAQRNGSLLLAFFFNAFGREPLEKSTAGLYRSLLHQLIDQDPPSLQEFRLVYEKRKQTQQHGKGKQSCWHDKEQNQLKDFFTQALERTAARGTKVTIFIDALDEAVQGSAQDVITYIHRLDTNLRDREPRTRICISCRHYPIYTATNRHEIFMENYNEVDIREFVRTELAEKGILRREFLENSGTLAALERELVKRAYGVFLWAFLITPVVVMQLNVATPLPVILDSLDQAPTRLGEIYSDVIRNVIHQDLRVDSYRLMKWAIRNDEPLQLVRIAVSVRFTATYAVPRTDPYLSEEVKDALEIRVGNFSGGLLEVKLSSRDRAAFFIHPTVKTFLKDEGLRLLSRLQGSESAGSSSSDLPLASFDELNPQGFRPRRDIRPTRRAKSQQGKVETAKRKLEPPSIDAHVPTEDETHGKRTAQWFERLSSETHALLDPGKAAKGRVKIAIINTGIDMSHESLQEAKDQIRQTKSWVDDGGDEETWGFGTYAAALVLKIAPTSELYIARIARDRCSSVDRDNIAQAIRWAIDCNVDIISVAFSFDQDDYAIDSAIHRANSLGIVVVAAVAGVGWNRFRVGFPARMEEVIAAYSADAIGNTSLFNPTPKIHDDNFSFLGEDVESAWPVCFGEGPKKHLSGSSVATAVAAGTAALILAFSRQESHLFQRDVLSYLGTPEGMRKVFRYSSSGRGSHGYVTPWRLLSKRQGSARIVKILEDILE